VRSPRKNLCKCVVLDAVSRRQKRPFERYAARIEPAIHRPRTKRTCVAAAIAHAANISSCRVVITAVRRTSPKLLFICVDLVKTDTALSLLVGQTSKKRESTGFGFPHFAYAASSRSAAVTLLECSRVAKAAIARRFCAYRTTVITYSIGKISGPACLYACRASTRSNNFAMDGLPSCTSSIARISMVRRTNCSVDASLTVGISK